MQSETDIRLGCNTHKLLFIQKNKLAKPKPKKLITAAFCVCETWKMVSKAMELAVTNPLACFTSSKPLSDPSSILRAFTVRCSVSLSYDRAPTGNPIIPVCFMFTNFAVCITKFKQYCIYFVSELLIVSIQSMVLLK